MPSLDPALNPQIFGKIFQIIGLFNDRYVHPSSGQMNLGDVERQKTISRVFSRPGHDLFLFLFLLRLWNTEPNHRRRIGQLEQLFQELLKDKYDNALRGAGMGLRPLWSKAGDLEHLGIALTNPDKFATFLNSYHLELETDSLFRQSVQEVLNSRIDDTFEASEITKNTKGDFEEVSGNLYELKELVKGLPAPMDTLKQTDLTHPILSVLAHHDKDSLLLFDYTDTALTLLVGQKTLEWSSSFSVPEFKRRWGVIVSLLQELSQEGGSSGIVEVLSGIASSTITLSSTKLGLPASKSSLSAEDLAQFLDILSAATDAIGELISLEALTRDVPFPEEIAVAFSRIKDFNAQLSAYPSQQDHRNQEDYAQLDQLAMLGIDLETSLEYLRPTVSPEEENTYRRDALAWKYGNVLGAAGLALTSVEYQPFGSGSSGTAPISASVHARINDAAAFAKFLDAQSDVSLFEPEFQQELSQLANTYVKEVTHAAKQSKVPDFDSLIVEINTVRDALVPAGIHHQLLTDLSVCLTESELIAVVRSAENATEVSTPQTERRLGSDFDFGP